MNSNQTLNNIKILANTKEMISQQTFSREFFFLKKNIYEKILRIFRTLFHGICAIIMLKTTERTKYYCAIDESE